MMGAGGRSCQPGNIFAAPITNCGPRSYKAADDGLESRPTARAPARGRRPPPRGARLGIATGARRAQAASEGSGRWRAPVDNRIERTPLALTCCDAGAHGALD